MKKIGRTLESLNSFFTPRNVAVIGASATIGRPGRTVIENLHANTFPGEIYPVNPRGGKICGHSVFKTVFDFNCILIRYTTFLVQYDMCIYV